MNEIIPLAEWYPKMYDRWLQEGRRLRVSLNTRKGYTVHHTGGGDNSDSLTYARMVAQLHFSGRGWRRPGGYNFQIGTDGSIFEMCGWDFVGAHAPGCNQSTIGVSFQGTFDSKLPNRKQYDSYFWLLGNSSVPIVEQGHRDCSSTGCPGNALYRELPIFEEDGMPFTEEDRKMLSEIHSVLAADQNQHNPKRIRDSLAALGEKVGVKVDPSRGTPRKDITA